MIIPPAAIIPAPAAPAIPPVLGPDGKPVVPLTTPPAAVRPAVTPPPAIPGATTVPLPELMEERNKRQALEKNVQDLQVEMAALRKVAPSPGAVAPATDYQKQLDQLWETDPRRAVQAEIMAAMTWYDKVGASIDSQEHTLTTKYPDYNTYRNEVRGYVRDLPIEQRMRDGIVELAYYAVKGSKVDDVMATHRTQWEAEFLEKIRRGEITSIPAGAISTPPVVPLTQATEEERKVADAMGMSVEDYLKHKRVGAK